MKASFGEKVFWALVALSSIGAVAFGYHRFRQIRPDLYGTPQAVTVPEAERKERIAYEFFGPASLLSEAGQPAPRPVAPPVADHAAEGDGLRIVLQKSGRSLAWDGTSQSILAFLEAQGIEPEFSCRAGVCGTCEHGLVSGEVDYFEEPLDVMPDDRVLLCCTRPKSSIVLDL